AGVGARVREAGYGADQGDRPQGREQEVRRRPGAAGAGGERSGRRVRQKGGLLRDHLAGRERPHVGGGACPSGRRPRGYASAGAREAEHTQVLPSRARQDRGRLRARHGRTSSRQ
ncbi:unnamed protein product, partial [Ectocarpus sp. 8 AP-2014]